LDLPSVTYFFALPKKVGKKRFWPSLFELLAQAIPENVTCSSSWVINSSTTHQTVFCRATRIWRSLAATMVVLAIAKGLVTPQEVNTRSISISHNGLTNRW